MGPPAKGEFAPWRNDGKRVAGRQRDNLIAPAGEKNVAIDEQRAGPLGGNDGEHRLEITFNGCPRHKDLHPDRTRRLLHGCRIALGIRVVRID